MIKFSNQEGFIKARGIQMIKNKFIKKFIENATLTNINIGCSGDQVHEIIKEDGIYYLKTSKGDSLKREYTIMKWLENILPVPKIIFYCEDDNYKYLLTKKLNGDMICNDEIYDYPEKVIFLASKAIRILQNVDISNCEFINDINTKLLVARNNIDNKLVSFDNVSDTNKNKFKSLNEIYVFLEKNKPQENLCFSHGDLSLPNVFCFNDEISGFLDLGDAGVADLWYDIAILIKSIRRNYLDYKYEKMLFKYLNLEPDYEKIEYYILLTELFT